MCIYFLELYAWIIVTDKHITNKTIIKIFQYPESEEERSYCDPDEDSLCDESNFDTVKKKDIVWRSKPIDPPVEFQDSPRRSSSGSRLLVSAGSHNSLSVPPANRVDDSSFITSAMSHDMLTDLYNVPLDSDIYTLPIDTVKPSRPHHRKHHRHGKRRRRHTAVECEIEYQGDEEKRGSKRHSAPGQSEPVHMTLQEVRQFLHTLYSRHQQPPEEKQPQPKKAVKNSFSYLLKRTLCNMFRVKRRTPPPGERALPPLPEKVPTHPSTVPASVPTLLTNGDEGAVDFASSIEKVKDYGWYWGPISGEAAEKILSNEPDGSFIVRDSSDHHYIFSLTFRLNGCVRHVRIEHDQGNFSFGSCTKFKSQTIVEFIETAVEHSRSGRYLFFLHRRPILGPMRVQLLHPVSRFKHVQSLQHMCRFVIVKTVRRDLIASLPLPRRLIDYLSSPHYYSEQLIDHQDQPSSPPSLHLFSFMPPN
ncbi:hypothetical protein AAG570_004504 [Ranatra chinensis]|uniref:Suppressor of cytokine signaling 7 n=1 Tax=Ranatra chinensis TaxID=642074 RepID=A0ABD0Y1V3_9HEMI